MQNSNVGPLVAVVLGLSLVWASSAAATTRGARRDAVDSIIVHTVSGPSCRNGEVVYSGAPGDADRWKRFFDRHPFLGIHYVVDRAGEVRASTPEDRMANHALDNNEGSIGIELVHDGDGIEPFAPAQIRALVALVRDIRTRHPIPLENVKGHADVDRRTFRCGGRTVKGRLDPGANFPWIEVMASLVDDAPELRLVRAPPPAPPPRMRWTAVVTPMLAPLEAPRLVARPRLVVR